MSIYIYLSIYLSTYLYIYVCVCVFFFLYFFRRNNASFSTFLCNFNEIGFQHGRTENLLTTAFTTGTEFSSTKNKNY